MPAGVGVPIRLIRTDGKKIPLMAESITMTVDRSVGSMPLPWAASTRVGMDFNRSKAAIVITGVFVDDGTHETIEGTKSYCSIDFARTANKQTWFDADQLVLKTGVTGVHFEKGFTLLSNPYLGTETEHEFILTNTIAIGAALASTGASSTITHVGIGNAESAAQVGERLKEALNSTAHPSGKLAFLRPGNFFTATTVPSNKVPTTSGEVATVTLTSGGSGYTAGTVGTTLTTPATGRGNGCQVTYTVSAGAISGITAITATGNEYNVGDILTVTGGGSDATITVATVKNPKVRIEQKITGYYGGRGPHATGWSMTTGSGPLAQPKINRWNLGTPDTGTKSAGDKTMDLFGSLNNMTNSGGDFWESLMPGDWFTSHEDNVEQDDEESGDYIIGIQIPYQSMVQATGGEDYVQRNFFMPTASKHDKNSKGSEANRYSVDEEFTLAGYEYKGIKGTVQQFVVTYDAGETVYNYQMTFLPIDIIM